MRDRPAVLRPTTKMSVTRRTRAVATETLRATVLFADLRGYTRLAEQLLPAQIVPLLDEFFHVCAAATAAHGGEVFHMAGDGMMAGFGVRDATQDGARAALDAGHLMLQQCYSMAERWRREWCVETGIGVGLHMGEVALGLLGPPGQKATTIVGDTVNVAARLCGRARAGEVLLSCTVAAALDASRAGGGALLGPIPILQLPQFELRGRSAPLDIWCVPAPERVAF